MNQRQELLESVLYPVVRVRAKSAGGSGTIVWSGIGEDNKFETYVLTNHHVIDSLIKVEKKYDPFLKRETMKESLSTAEIEVFVYPAGSRLEGRLGMNGDIIAYSKDLDLGLLKLRSSLETQHVANLAPSSREDEICLAEPVYAVGAALGHEPMMTEGIINFMDDEIDNTNYWLTSAAIIFGNSGGAVFLRNTYEFIGVPSRIAVANIGWSAAPITHMGFLIPFPVIYQWLRDQYYHFIIGEATYDQCKEDRERAQDEMRRMSDLNAAQLNQERATGQYYSP